MPLKLHPLAEMFPPLPPAAYKELLEDIRKHGIRFPVTTFEGKILDGAHRYRCALELGIEPPIKAYREDDPAGYVYSANSLRRHMTGSQLVHVITALAKSQWAKRGGDRDSN